MQLIFILLLATTVTVQGLNETSFRPGVSYTYDYQGQVLTGIGLDAVQQGGLKINCKCVLQIQTNNVVMLLMQDIRLFKVNQELKQNESHNIIPEELLQVLVGDQADQLKEQLVKPFSFRYRTGEISDVRSTIGDPYWSTNIKKGIVSLLQISLKADTSTSYVYGRRTRAYYVRLSSYNVTENDASGNCDTRYVVSSVGANSSAVASKLHVSKVKNFDKCRSSNSYVQGLFAGHLRAEKNFIDRTVHSDYVITGDRSSFLIDQVQLQAHYVLTIPVHTGQQATTRILQKMSLSGTSLLSNPTRLSNSFQSDQLGLGLDIPKTSLMPHVDLGNALQKHNYTDLIDKKLTALVGMMYPKVHEASLRNMLELHHLLRHIHFEQLSLIVKTYVIRDSEENNTGAKLREYKRDILLRTLPTISSPDVSRVLADLVREGHLSGFDAGSSINTMSLIIKPTPAVIASLWKLWKDLPSDAASTRQTVLLAIGTIGHRLSQMMSLSPKPQLIVAIESISTEFQRLLTTSTTEKDRVNVIDAIANIGKKSFVPVLKMIIEDKTLPKPRRLAAISALRKTIKPSDEQGVSILLGVYMDRAELPEVRRASLRLLLSGQPHHTTLQLIGHSLRTEPIGQLKTLAYSLFVNIARLQSNVPELQALAGSAQSVLKMIHSVPMGWRDSQQYQLSYYSDDLNIGGSIKLDVLRSEKARLPETISFSINAEMFGQSLQLATFELATLGREKLLQKFLGKEKWSFSSLLSFISKTDPLEILDKVREIVAEVQMNLKTATTTTTAESFETVYFVQVFQHELNKLSLSLDVSTMNDFMTTASGILLDLKTKLSSGYAFDSIKTFALASNSLVISTPLGVSLSVNVSMITVGSLQGYIKATNLPSFSDIIRSDAAVDKMKIDYSLNPSVSALLLGHMGTDMRWLYSGAGFKATLNAALPVNGEIMFDRKNQMLEYKYNTTEEEVQLLGGKIVPFTYIHYVPKTIDKLPFFPEVKPTKAFLMNNKVERWSYEKLGMRLFINRTKGKEWMVTATGNVTQLFAKISTDFSNRIEDLNESTNRKSLSSPSTEVLIIVGTIRQQREDQLKCRFQWSVSESWKSLLNVHITDLTNHVTLTQKFTVNALVLSNALSANDDKQSFVQLNVSWTESAGRMLTVSAKGSLSNVEDWQKELEDKDFNVQFTSPASKYSFELNYPDMCHSIRTYIATTRDAIKYHWYPYLSIRMPETVQQNKMSLHFYLEQKCQKMSLILESPYETGYILNVPMPRWLFSAMGNSDQQQQQNLTF